MDRMAHIFEHGASLWVRFTNHRGKECRFRAVKKRRSRRGEQSSRQIAEAVKGNLLRLVDLAAAGLAIPDDLMDWTDRLDHGQAQRLVAWGLIGERRMLARESLDQIARRWHDFMVNGGLAEAEARMRYRRVLNIIDGCDWRDCRDIDAEALLACIERWRRAGAVPNYNRKATVSERTLKHYVDAMRQFSRWLVHRSYLSRDPLLQVRGRMRQPAPGAVRSNMAERRPLAEDEQIRLLQAACAGPVRHHMTGAERVLLYRIALETGLRGSAIRRLLPGDVTADGWLVAGGIAGNKASTPKPLRPDLLAMLQTHAEARGAGAPLLDLPPACELARMLRADCEAAGIDTVGVDFHCLRHTFGTTLARKGVHPKTLMGLMDHSDINMTMRLYTHSMPEDERRAMDLLPDLSDNAGASKRRQA